MTDEDKLVDAVYRRDISKVKLLLEQGVNPNKAPANVMPSIYWASTRGYSEIVELLLENGADPNVKTHEGYTPIFWAALKGYPKIVKILHQYYKDNNIPLSEEEKESIFKMLGF